MKSYNVTIMSRIESTKKRRELGNTLREKGFKIISSYKDPLSGGTKYSLELGQVIGRHDTGILHKGETIKYPIWANMKDYSEDVLDIIQRFFPSAELKWYRGFTNWLARYEIRIKYPKRGD